MFEDFSFDATEAHKQSWHPAALMGGMPWTSDSLSSNEDSASPLHSRPASPLLRRHEAISIDALAHHLSAHTLRPHASSIPTPPCNEMEERFHPNNNVGSPISISAHSTPQETSERATIRNRRQANVRLQCDTAHLAAIAQLVEEMVSRGGTSATCHVSPPPSPKSTTFSSSKSLSWPSSTSHRTPVIGEDEGYDDAETEEERLRQRRRSSRLGFVNEPMRERCGVIKIAASMGPTTHVGGLRGVYGRAKDAARARRTRNRSLSRNCTTRS